MSYIHPFSCLFALCCLLLGAPLLAEEVQRDAASDSRILELLNRNHAQLQAIQSELAAMRRELQALKRGDRKPAVRSQAAVKELQLTGEEHAIGSPDAPVVIVEFSDYQCPFCARFYAQTFPVLKKQYIDSGKVRLVSRDFPLGFHGKARSAALAANCAAEQGAYEAMRLGLFKENRRLGKGLYTRLARKLGLDMAAFEACQRDAERAKRIDEDLAVGKRVGVAGTPSFFIGKHAGDKVVEIRNLRGAQPYRSFAKAIDTLLEH